MRNQSAKVHAAASRPAAPAARHYRLGICRPGSRRPAPLYFMK